MSAWCVLQTHAGTCAQVEEAHALSQRVVSFLEAAGGQADSGELIAHFAPALSAAQAPLFRQLLQLVAKLRRSAASGGRKSWVLRPEFFVSDSSRP
jgi:hypothetical protein